MRKRGRLLLGTTSFSAIRRDSVLFASRQIRKSGFVALRRAQVSTELLVLVGVMLAMLLPLLFYSYTKASIANEDMAVQKAEFDAERLARLADSVGYLGGESAIVEEIEIPSFVKKVSTNEKDIIIELATSAGRKQIVKTTAFPLTDGGLGNITQPGTYFIEVRANGTGVRLSLR